VDIFQTITPERGIVNHTRFGGQLQAYCQLDKMVEVLPEYGFMDGGCLSLALALQALIPGSQICFVCTLAMPQHAVLRLPAPLHREALYLDADGLANGPELCEKMRTVENLRGRVFVAELDWREVIPSGICDGDNASVKLREVLRPLLTRNPCSPAWLA
jgi:hypothetical protein